jgi:hypothetical protein
MSLKEADSEEDVMEYRGYRGDQTVATVNTQPQEVGANTGAARRSRAREIGSLKEADSEEDVSGGAATPTRTPTVVTIHSGDSNDEDGGIDSVEAQQPEDANTARTTQPRTDAAVVETDGDDGAKKSLSGSNKRQRGESSGGQVSRRGRPGRRPSAENLDRFARLLREYGEFTSNKEAIRRKMGSGWSVKRIDGFYETNEIELDRRRRELGQGAQQGEHATAVTKNQESDKPRTGGKAKRGNISLLLDANIIRDGMQVEYRANKKSTAIKRGTFVVNGKKPKIECGCCRKQFGTTNFEVDHCKQSGRKPNDHLWVEMGGEWKTIQMLMDEQAGGAATTTTTSPDNTNRARIGNNAPSNHAEKEPKTRKKTESEAPCGSSKKPEASSCPVCGADHELERGQCPLIYFD